METKQRIEAVIFDLDDTLFDTEKLKQLGFKVIVEMRDEELDKLLTYNQSYVNDGGKAIQASTIKAIKDFKKEWQNSNGGSEPKFTEVFVKELNDKMPAGSSASTEALFKKEFGQSFPYNQVREARRLWEYKYFVVDGEIPAFKNGAEELLKYLKEKEIPIGIGTSTTLERAKILLKLTRIHDWFDVIIGSDSENVKLGKPAPDTFSEGIRLIGAKASNVLVIEDGWKGSIAALRAGAIPIYVPVNGTEPTEEKMNNPEVNATYEEKTNYNKRKYANLYEVLTAIKKDFDLCPSNKAEKGISRIN